MTTIVSLCMLPIDIEYLETGMFIIKNGRPGRVYDCTHAKAGKHGMTKAHYNFCDLFTQTVTACIGRCGEELIVFTPIVTEYKIVEVHDNSIECRIFGSEAKVFKCNNTLCQLYKKRMNTGDPLVHAIIGDPLVYTITAPVGEIGFMKAQEEVVDPEWAVTVQGMEKIDKDHTMPSSTSVGNNGSSEDWTVVEK